VDLFSAASTKEFGMPDANNDEYFRRAPINIKCS